MSMPELPEVETTRRGLLKILPGRHIQQIKIFSPRLRLPIPTDLPLQLEKNSVVNISRRAKYMIWELARGPSLLVHLGMSGRFRHVTAKNYAPDKHDHVALWLSDGNVLAYHDPRRFGLIDWAHDAVGTAHAWLDNIGIEPLSDELNAAWLYAKLRGRKVSMKAVLLDQKMLNGLGNIYVSEALFLAGIRPTRSAARVTQSESEKLAPAIKKVLLAAIDAGGSTLRDYRDVDGQIGFFQDRFHVYDRAGEGCKKCRTEIKQLTQNGRSSYYCAKCQK